MKYSFKEHLDDITEWAKVNEIYNADTLSWCLTIAYERWNNKLELFSKDIEK